MISEISLRSVWEEFEWHLNNKNTFRVLNRERLIIYSSNVVGVPSESLLSQTWYHSNGIQVKWDSLNARIFWRSNCVQSAFRVRSEYILVRNATRQLFKLESTLIRSHFNINSRISRGQPAASQTDSHPAKQTATRPNKQLPSQTDRQTDCQTARQLDNQTTRQSDNQTTR